MCLCNSCNTATHGLLDMYTPSPVALGVRPWVYISGRPPMPAVQPLCSIWQHVAP